MVLKVRHKLLALVLLSILGALAIAAMALAYFISQDRAEATQHRFAAAFAFVHEELTAVETRLHLSARQLAVRADLIAAASLIPDYTPSDRYDPYLFDVEKQRLARELARHAVASQLAGVYLRDHHGELMAFAVRGDGVMRKGIVSYERRKPAVLVAAHGSERYLPAALPPTIGALRDSAHRDGSRCRPFADGFDIEITATMHRALPAGGSRAVGVITVSEHIGAAFEALVSHRTDAHFQILPPSAPAAASPIDRTALRDVPLLTAPGTSATGRIENDTHLIQARAVRCQTLPDTYLLFALPKAAIDAEVRRTAGVVLLAMLLSAALAIPAALFFARRWVARPVRELMHGATLVRDGRYDVPITLPAQDEFGAVASAFNDMAATVRQREQDLREERAGLETRVGERTAALRLANTSLEREVQQRKAIETALRESRRMLELVMNNIPQAVFWKDRQSVFLGCNAVFAKAAGLGDPANVVGKTDYDLPWRREESDFFTRTDRRVMAQDMPELKIVEPILMADGRSRLLETNKIPLHDGAGEVIGILGTFEDITERAAAQQELVRARNEAQKASQAKSEFLSRMSHELRTPLNAVLGFAQLLDTDTVRPLSESHRDSVNEILTAGRHLLEIINDLLDLARIEAGHLVLVPEDVALDELLATVLSLARPLAEARGVRLAYEGGAPIRVHADPTRLKQVLLNLVSNAIKYNRPQGSVMISTAVNDDRAVRISVRDTGKGIVAALLPRLFHPFERLGREKSGIDGVGIGLTITRSLVEAMGGQIGVESVPDEGSSFWFELPLAAAATTPVS